ncbi:rhombosortase [Duganella qianjiadongensis]|uniref:Rhombosortase n=1 Tax=Duganella qianjiadongensis TaxID=2692176 RepID=A0ABW9VPY8_9BURK|nr:rhombosortase [Duganella qianjiadongensis]MYM40660.1 rhombosortase [Duganella qianjiadongensis]
MASAAARANWPGVSITLTLAACALQLAPAELAAVLAYDRTALLGGQWWRLWSCHLVHYSAAHALSDGTVVLLCGWLLEPTLGRRRLCLTLGWSSALIALLLLLWVPALSEYRGLSALAVMLMSMTLITLWRQRRLPRPWLALLASLLLLKTGAEALGMMPASQALPADIQLVWQAHVLGMVCGVLNTLPAR